tara:strand:+ start:1236 stop:2054 length:819 start_codon:yes stop_codon:yes gene_type:complete
MNNLLLTALKKYDIDTLIHVGGHRGQEVDFYKSLNLDKVIYFEPVESFALDIEKKIKSLDNFELYKLALGSEDTEVDIFVADKGENDDTGSTSILEPRKSKITFSTTEKVKVRKLSSLDIKNFDCAVVDTQGYELEVLKGFEDEISNFKFLIMEFSTIEGYIGRVVYKDLNKYLNEKNFYMYTQWKIVANLIKTKTSGSYGDALYVNGNLLSPMLINYLKLKFIFLNNPISEFINYFSKIHNLKKILKNILKKLKLYNIVKRIKDSFTSNGK